MYEEEKITAMTKNEFTSYDGPIAVVGATGQQGGAVASALLGQGAKVRALVRDTATERAQSLARAGAEVAVSDLDEPETVVDALRGVGAVFAMTTFAGPAGTDGEVRHGQALADAIREAGVERVVYNSVGGAERATDVPHFESKRRVEERLEALGLHTTFVRPTFFMDNFATFSRPSVEHDGLVVRLPLPDEVPLQMISVRDVGRVSAAVLLHPDRLAGEAIEVAGDELTGSQIASAFSAVRDIPVRYEALPVEVLEDEDQRRMFTWFSDLPAYRADWGGTRELVTDMDDLQTWIERTNI